MYSEGPSCGTCKYFLLRAHNEYPCSDCINGNLWKSKLNLEILESPNGHYIKEDNKHMVYFLCSKENLWCNKLCDSHSCAHTLYLERSKNYQDMCPISEEEFFDRFEKIYFAEGDWYDWWEKEKPKQIWNCRTHEWEDEE